MPVSPTAGYRRFRIHHDNSRTRTCDAKKTAHPIHDPDFLMMIEFDVSVKKKSQSRLAMNLTMPFSCKTCTSPCVAEDGID